MVYGKDASGFAFVAFRGIELFYLSFIFIFHTNTFGIMWMYPFMQTNLLGWIVGPSLWDPWKLCYIIVFQVFARYQTLFYSNFFFLFGVGGKGVVNYLSFSCGHVEVTHINNPLLFSKWSFYTEAGLRLLYNMEGVGLVLDWSVLTFQSPTFVWILKEN